MSTLFSRIKYMNRPEVGLQSEVNLFKKGCRWIGQDVPENSYFQLRLTFNNMGIANDCWCEVFQDNESLGEFDVLATQSVHDVVNFN